MRFFDINCYLGQPISPLLRSFATPDELLREMDDAGIERAMVSHHMAQAYTFKGNRQLMRETRGRDRLVPAWLIHPNHMLGSPDTRELLSELDDNGIRMVRLFTGEGLPYPWMIDDLLSGLAERRMLLYLDISTTRQLSHQPVAESAWPVVHDLAHAYPAMQIVLFAHKLSAHHMQVRGLLRSCPNISLDTSSIQLWRVIERVTKAFGPERLLFGSCMPTFQAAQFVIELQYAPIAPAAREAIAFRNLESRLGME